jgi:hypothetical protein
MIRPQVSPIFSIFLCKEKLVYYYCDIGGKQPVQGTVVTAAFSWGW